MTSVRVNTIEVPGASESKAPVKSADGASFSQALGEAIEKVDALQTQADGEAQKLAAGGGNLHETALALEKADVAMRVALKVRNKILDAYNEVMRMAV